MQMLNKKIKTDHILPFNHMHTHMCFMCFWWCSLLLYKGIAGKVSHNLGERVALRCCLTSRDTEEAVPPLVSLFYRR